MRYVRAAMAWAISAALVIQPTLVYALPTGGTVVGGEANIVVGSSSLTVNQTTERALINWTGFDIGGAESVHFNQPGASSISLNRVNSASASQINGSLSSNGQVWIINQNGVMFGQGAQVNVGGLLVSTANISDDNFMNGNYQFNIAGNPNASIVNDGNITVADAGVASLVAPVVRNNGVIQAKLGTVNLASGDTFALDMYGDGLISVEASAALQQQLVSNSGLIEANGGSVLLTAAAAGDVVDSLINMDGVIRANSIGEKNGTVVLYAEGSNAVKGNIAADKGQKQGTSTILVSGTIEAKGNAAGEKGGNIDVLGDHVGVMSGGFIDASGQIGGGKIRIGGDYFGGADTPTALATLVQRNTTIKANAIESGDGGRITIWSDHTTWFGGSIEAKGGAFSGDGGFVEVSGKQYLSFKGAVDTRAENGETGLLLLDPADIVIADGSGDSAADGNNTFSGDPSGTIGTILSGDTGPSTIYESELEGLGANTNISLAATNSITINNLADNNLNLAQDGGNSVTFTAGGGGFNMNTGDTITTAGGAINIVTTGGTSTIGSLASNGGIITLNMGGDITVSGVISGTGTALTKTGSGTVLLSNANTYTGNTTITDGIIDVGHNNALGTGTLVMNGGGLRDDGTLRTLANNISVTANNSAIGGSAGLTFNGTMTFEGEHALNNYNGGTVTFGNVNLSNSATDQLVTFANHGSDMIINGVIANGGTSTASSIRKNGAGTLILNGNNTFGGGLNIAAGTLTVGHNNAAGTGTLTLNGGTLTASGSRTLANNVDITNDSAIAGSSAIQFDGTFGNANGTRYLDVSNSATTTFGNINISSDGSDRFIIFTGSGNTVVNGVVANGGGSTGSGIGLISSGSLTLNGNNTYGGNFYHDGGTLILGHDNALGTNNFLAYGGTIQAAGGTRTIANNISYWDNTTFAGSNALVFNGDFYNTNNLSVTNNNSATTTFANIDLSYDASNFTLTFGGTGNTVVGGVISNGGGGSTTSAITKIGSGTLTLDGNNTYGGTTTLTAGTIEVGHNNALGTGTLSLNGGTLQGDGVARTLANTVNLKENSTIGGSSALIFSGAFGHLVDDWRTLTVNNSALTTFGDINISATGVRELTLAGTGDITVNGVLSGGSSGFSSISKTGSGKLTLNGANTYGGNTYFSGGTIEIGNDSAFGSSGLSLFGDTVLQGDGTTRTISNNVSIHGAGSQNPVYISGSSDLIFTGTFGNISSDRTLTVNNSGLTSFNNINISNSATDRVLTMNGTGNVVVGGTIANGSTSTASGITKDGSGTLTLDGNNTYGGTTTLTAGTIEIGHNNALGTGTLSLNGGTLQGDGTARTLANNITLAANSTIGGTSALQFDGTFGNLTADRNLTNNNSSTVTFGNIVISGNNNNRWLDISGTGTNIVNGVISSGGSSSSSIRINNSGNLTLNGANTHRSVDFGSSGILQIGNDSALGVNTFYIAGGGRIQGDGVARTLANNIALYSSVTMQGSSDLTFSGTLTNGLANQTVTVNNSGLTTFNNINLSNDGTNRTMTISGTGNTVVSGTVANGGGSAASNLTKTGSGTLTLDGNNTYAGTTTLTAGTIEVGHNNALGTGTLSLNGGTLQGDGTARTLANNVTLAANSTIGGSSALQFDGTFGNLSADRTLTVSNSATTTFDDINISANGTDRQLTFDGAGNVTVNGVIDNGGGSTNSTLLKAGSGVLALNGANSFGRFILTEGITQIGNNDAFGSAAVWLGGPGGTLRGDGVARTITNDLSLYNNTTIAGSSDLTFSGTLTNTDDLTLTVNNSGNTTLGAISLSNSGTDRTLTLTGTGNTTVSGVISNGGSTASGITKTGSGTLTLDGNNTYAGTTTLTAGTIEVGHNNALGTGILSLNGGTLQGDGVARTLANDVTLAADSTIAGSSALQFDGTFGNLTAVRTLTVSNSANTTFDDINISANATDRELFLNGTGNIIVNGVVANGGGSSASIFTQLGSGTITLNGANTFGRYTAGNGITQIGNDSALGSGIVWFFGGALQGDGVTRTLANNIAMIWDTTIAGSSDLIFNGTMTSSDSRTITNNNSGTTTFANINLSNNATDRTLGFAGTGNTVISGVIANGGTSTTSGIIKTGSGTLTLDGNNTYGGTTTLTAGTIEVGHNNALGTGTLSLNGGTLRGDGVARTLSNNVTLAASSTIGGTSALQFDGTFGNLSANRDLTVNNSGTTTFGNINISDSATNRRLTIDNTGDIVVNGTISNGSTSAASSFWKYGSGSLTLNGNNTYGGTTVHSDGTIIAGSDTAFGTGSITLNGGTLRGNGVSRTLANALTLGFASTISGNSAISFTGELTNTGNLTLTNSNSATTTFGNIALSGDASDNTLTLAGNGNTVISGAISNGGTSTASGITKTGNGILTLSGNNTYTGDTTINGGTLRLGAANRLANTTDIVIGASGTFDMDGFNETVATVTNGGAITMGTGNTLTTTGAQTHTGSISGTDISIIANTGNLTFDTISANTLFAQAVAGDIILNDQITVAANAGTSITLVADDQFINNFGATALQTAGTARWLVYSEDSANNTRGGLAGFNRYGCTYNAGSPSCAVGTDTPATGNGFYFNVAPTITITGLTANNKTYDGTTTAILAGTATANGAINGDTITFDASGVTATFDTKDVGVGKTVTISGYAFATNMGYLLTQPSTVLANVTAKALTIAGLTAANKVYDGNTTATLSGVGALVGVVGVETVGFNAGTATFDNANVGTGKTVTGAGFSLNGIDAGNYSLTQPSWFADITAAAGGGGGGSVSSGNQTTINAILSLLGLLGNNGMASGTSVGGTFQFAGGIPEPSRMEIPPVEDEVPTNDMNSKPAHDYKKIDPIIEINAMIDLNGLLKDTVETGAGKQVAVDAEIKVKKQPEVQDDKEAKNCNSLLGNAVCASRIFSTVGVPNI